MVFWKSKKDDGLGQSEHSDMPSQGNRPEGKKMKKSFSSRFFGSSKKNLGETSTLDGSNHTDGNQSLPTQEDTKYRSPLKQDLKQDIKEDISPNSEMHFDNRSMSSMHDEDEHKGDIPEERKLAIGDDDDVSSHKSEFRNPAFRMMEAPPDVKLRKTNTLTREPSAPLPKRPAESAGTNQRRERSRSDLSDAESAPLVNARQRPRGRTTSNVSDVSDQEKYSQIRNSPIPTPPMPPRGPVPPSHPPMTIRTNTQELQNKVSTLKTPVSNRPSLPVKPPAGEAIGVGRSALKHTSAAQERRMQQQRQQQQAQPVYGRALLKQTSQFDRLVGGSTNSPSNKQLQQRQLSSQYSKAASPPQHQSSLISQSKRQTEKALIEGKVDEEKRSSLVGNLFRAPSDVTEGINSSFGSKAVNLANQRITRKNSLGMPTDDQRAASPQIDDVSVISSISGASGLISSHQQAQLIGNNQQSSPELKSSRQTVPGTNKKPQQTASKPTSKLKLPVSATAPRNLARSNTSVSSVPSEPPPSSVSSGDQYKRQLSTPPDMTSGSQPSSPSLPPPPGSSVGDQEQLDFLPPPSSGGNRSDYNKTATTTTPKRNKKDDTPLTSVEKRKLIEEEKEKWKILPSDPEHNKSKIRRLFKPVNDEEVVDGGYSDKQPVLIEEGTLAAEFMKLIETTRMEGGGKPKVVEKKPDIPAITLADKPAAVSTAKPTDDRRSSLTSTKKPFQGAAPSGPTPYEDDDELKSMDSADFDEDEYFKLIAALPGLNDLGEKECWEMKTEGGPKINVMFGGSTQSTLEAAKLIEKAKKQREKKQREENEKMLHVNIESEDDFKMLTETIRSQGKISAPSSGGANSSRVERGTMMNLLTTMVPLRVGMDDAWRQNDDAIRMKRQLSDGSKPSRRATGDMTSVDLRFLLAHDKSGQDVDRYVDFSIPSDRDTEGEEGKQTHKGGKHGQGKPMLSYREKLWRRAGDHNTLSFSTTDPELRNLKSSAAKQGMDLLEREFGSYRNKDEWEGLEVFKRNRKQRIVKSGNTPAPEEKPRTASDAITRRRIL